MKATRALALAVAAAVLASSGPRAGAQAPRRPTFGVEIEVINLNLSVTDARNNYVTDLAQRDFAVFEDGIRQELTLFNHDNLPISMSILVDTSSSMVDKLATAQAAAIRFTKTLRSQDAAQVTQFNDRTTVLQDFTNDHALLEAAIRKTEASSSTSLYNALYIALKDLDKQKKAGESRRRAVVLLSDGEDTGSLVSDEQLLELARKTEINVYPISLRSNYAVDRQRTAFSQAEHILTALARETGGRAFFPNSISELDSVYEKIAEELRTQYNLGYVSSNSRRDGKWRRIVVRTPERDDVQVRHKLGYFAPRT